MAAESVCSHGGSHELASGDIQSTGTLRFRPEQAACRFFTLRTADVAVHALMCADCGAVRLVGDVEKLRQIGRPARETEAAVCSTT